MAMTAAITVLAALSCSFWAVSAQQCDIYNGSWVRDDSYPLYDSASCPFIRREFDCQRYGRPDHDYLKFRWQPADCDLPKFDGENLLRRWAGKKVMLVGDSLTLNQYISLLCMVHAAVPNAVYNYTRGSDGTYTATFQEYNATVVYFLSHYLVDIVREEMGRVLKLNSMSSGAVWLTADFLVFNTGHWWYTKGASQSWDYIQDGQQIVKDMDRTEAFSHAMQTWANWVDSAVDPATKRLFFTGLSPSHYNGSEWGEPGRTCAGQTEPTSPSSFTGGSIPQQVIVNELLKVKAKQVKLLDISYLSQLRKDAHSSKYNGANFSNDCSHWCVAGLPDTWNQLFYAALIA
ncbi:protein trichome birefringence-like 38 [Zingiber officinale]|uniref:protein trichome birefringence-like 38 n=1 Tax=Zingiber officinale TaxID=94328 RepID=UPI001C4B02FE|nr:protein trichome birefringence-like 38 [Zingiber officinale]